ncbi:MAG: RpiB/LacA/LacB family sugar-phosphate isomerase [Candidatus Actinomarina sp.]|nr:RpiB/LacA/LacB family sugar-phosphate isomerase [Candidatus Actinomarina sp.]
MFTKVAIASDHAGYELKNYILNNLNRNIVVNDFGTNSTESCDFPDYASKVCEYILENQDYRGVLICGSGVGMSIAANKFAGIRAANVNDKATAIQSVEHNNVNVLSLGSNNINSEDAMDIISAFLEAVFTKEERYLRRINKLSN